MQRRDDFEYRRKHLAGLSEGELEELFWSLTEKIVNPLVELAYTNTSPSIERSVLLRMGFDSITATAVVDLCEKKGFLGKGVGHVILKFARYREISMKESGRKLARGEGWDEMETALKIDLKPEGR